MEFAASIEPFLSPLAAFLDPNDSSFLKLCQAENDELANANQSAHAWSVSACNPRNRLNALHPRTSGSWRIDGCAAMGRQLFATPTFLLPDVPVKRIDVLIPCQSTHPPALRQILQSPALYHMSSAAVRRLDVARYFEQVLSAWSSKLPYFKEIYGALPFGSRIIVENVAADINKVKVRFLSNAGFADRLASLDHLRELWGLPSRLWPAVVRVDKLRHVRHLNGNVSVVEMPQKHGQEHLVFKTNLRDPAAIYHELRLLMTMDPHPNIVGRPRYIVISESEDGPESQSKVLGFVLDYIGSGTLSAALERNPNLPLPRRMRWATQVVRIIDDLHNSPVGFYSDLKPDNLLLTQDGLDLVLIDFEQGGNWDTFLAPEISYAMWMETLARSAQVPQTQRDQYTALLQTIQSDRAGKEISGPPTSQTQLFRSQWESLDPQRREQAMVFTVGKLLWCIFEGVSHTRNSTDERYEWKTPIEFPNFSRTPDALRGLIRQCTAGAPEWGPSGEPAGIARQKVKFVALTTTPGVTGDGAAEDGCTPREAMDAAKRLWTYRVQQMQEYMEASRRWVTDSSADGDDVILGFPSRPSLAQVLQSLIESGGDGIHAQDIR